MNRKLFYAALAAILSLSLLAKRSDAQKSETDHVIRFFQWKVAQDSDDCFNFDRLGTAYI